MFVAGVVEHQVEDQAHAASLDYMLARRRNQLQSEEALTDLSRIDEQLGHPKPTTLLLFQELDPGSEAQAEQFLAVAARVRDGGSVLLSLSADALESAVVAADSMTARGFGLSGRTHFALFRWEARDTVLAGVMVIVAAKTFSWHSLQPATVKTAPIAETVVMLVTVAATVSTGNLAIGVLGGIIVMALLPARIKRRLKAEKSSPAQEK